MLSMMLGVVLGTMLFYFVDWLQYRRELAYLRKEEEKNSLATLAKSVKGTKEQVSAT